MKKILITGANSYIGTSFEKWVSQYANQYVIETLDMRNDMWKESNFSYYDVVLHVAGIVHKKEKKNNIQSYYDINRDLSYEVAKKAKEDGVRQYIFLSSMSVYGLEIGIIDEDTIPNPKSNYGKSKLQAEVLISRLCSPNFKIAILRPPMVYGEGCKGNYQKIKRYILKFRIFPKLDNKRSMIYIYNLCEFIRLVIDNEEKGIFFPQNNEFVCTSNMVFHIARANNKKIFLTTLFNPLLKSNRSIIKNKLFGDLIYDIKLSSDTSRYALFKFEDTIVGDNL